MTRRALTVGTLILLLSGGPASAESSFSAGIGGHFFRYDRTYLTAVAANYLFEMQDGLELNIGGEFNITTERTDSEDIVPRFLIPAQVGFNFTFARDRVVPVFGTGLTPVFTFQPDSDGQDFIFYMGPYVRGEIRLRVHPIMSVFIAAQQDLLIGGPEWINTATRVHTGINFAFTGPVE